MCIRDRCRRRRAVRRPPALHPQFARGRGPRGSPRPRGEARKRTLARAPHSAPVPRRCPDVGRGIRAVPAGLKDRQLERRA
eukprot:7036024-Prymnesium_polylepis.1